MAGGDVLSWWSQIVRLSEVRHRAAVTLAAVALFRLGQYVPLPGVDVHAAQNHQVFSGAVKVLMGNALPGLSLFGLSVFPVVTARLLLDLAVITVPRMGALAREGSVGAAAVARMARVATVPVALLMAWAVVTVGQDHGLLRAAGTGAVALDVVCLVAGSVATMGLAEVVSRRGLGNGYAVLVLVQVLAVLPGEFWAVREQRGLLPFVALLFLGPLTFMGQTFVERAERTVPVQYAKRMTGRRPSGGGSAYITVEFGELDAPVTFSASLLYWLALVAQLLPHTGWTGALRDRLLAEESTGYLVLLTVLILVFTAFYAALEFEPEAIADELKRVGGFVPGIRPGRPTAQYLRYVQHRLTWPRAVAVAALALAVVGFSRLLGGESAFPFGGEAIFIAAALAAELLGNMEAVRLRRAAVTYLR